MGHGTPEKKPVLYWDGDCGFCRHWVERWKDNTGAHVDYETLQTAPPHIVEAAGGDPPRQIVLAEPDGSLLTGAHAALASQATAGGIGRLLLRAYRAVPAFRKVSEVGYSWVAGHRGLCSSITRLLWGDSTRVAAYEISGWIFPRVVGLVFLCAFLSLWVQIDGLAGSRGILPVAAQLEAARHLPAGAFLQMPSLLWLGAGDTALHLWLLAGTAASALLMAGLVPAASAFVAWACYLSFATTVPVFLNFQWDALLLETGLLTVFYVPWRRSLALGRSAPPRLARLLVWWLLFRLMFESGVVKLHGFDAAGHNAWLDGTALHYHYFTQPIPAWTSWWAAQLPDLFQRASLVIVFAIQLVLPFVIPGPRRLRMVAFWGFTALMLLILLSGNYGFFNLLALALCLTLVDDGSWPSAVRRALDRRTAGSGAAAITLAIRVQRLVLPWFAAVVIFLTTVQLLLVLRAIPRVWGAPVLENFSALRSTNSYGLFSVMTTERPEITIEASEDGRTWQPYAFRYKMAPDDNTLPLFPPHMPRLDWQMWFAALEFRATGQLPGWIVPLFSRLGERSEPVLGLLNPGGAAGLEPRFFRLRLDLLTLGPGGTAGRVWDAQSLPEYTLEGSLQREP